MRPKTQPKQEEALLSFGQNLDTETKKKNSKAPLPPAEEPHASYIESDKSETNHKQGWKKP